MDGPKFGKNNFEETKIIEETKNAHLKDTRPENIESFEDGEENYEREKKALIQKITEIKIRELTSHLKKESLNVPTEKFRSGVRAENATEAEIPADHPLMPLLKAADKILGEGKVSGAKSPDEQGNLVEKHKPTIERALYEILQPMYDGQEKPDVELSPEALNLVHLLFEGSAKEGNDFSLKATTSSFGKASAHLISSICTFSPNDRLALPEMIQKFQNEVTA